MIKLSNNTVGVMEFTSFKKKENVTDDALLTAVLQFESSFLATQKGIVSHCLVRNFNNEYANVLFAENMESLKQLEKTMHSNEAVQTFFDMVQEDSVTMNFNHIEKKNFKIPANFSCIEYGTFSLKNETDFKNLLTVSETIEKEYLENFKNTQAHFIGTIEKGRYSEVTFGTTLGKTKEICFGYTNNPICMPLLEMADESTMQLDFWYLIA